MTSTDISLLGETELREPIALRAGASIDRAAMLADAERLECLLRGGDD